MTKLKIKKTNNHQGSKNKILVSILILIFFILSLNLTTINLFTENNTFSNEQRPKTSWFWATLDLTNPGEVNNSRFTQWYFS